MGGLVVAILMVFECGRLIRCSYDWFVFGENVVVPVDVLQNSLVWVFKSHISV